MCAESEAMREEGATSMDPVTVFEIAVSLFPLGRTNSDDLPGLF